MCACACILFADRSPGPRAESLQLLAAPAIVYLPLHCVFRKQPSGLEQAPGNTLMLRCCGTFPIPTPQ